MNHLLRFVLLCIAVPSLFVLQLLAQAAPVPPQVASAKKVFIANLGVDGLGYELFQQPSVPYQPYDAVYRAMQHWGRYELVTDPASADVVFEVSLATALSDTKTNTDRFSAYIAVKVIDVKTHFTVWTLTQPLNVALLTSNRQKDLLSAVDALITQLKGVVDAPHP